MIIIGAQVKHQPKGDTFVQLDRNAKRRLTELFGQDHEFITLVLTTHVTDHKTIPKHTICFDCEGLRIYTQHFGYLNLIDTKTM